jgi:hypothetical protein
MKKLLVYTLAAMLALPVMGSEPTAVINKKEQTKTELSAASLFGKKKNKKGKKKKRKNIYRPGARQN